METEPKNITWTMVWNNKKHSGFPPSKYEKTDLTDLPGGWLLRHRFIAGKQFTRSGIIYVPDAQGIWNLSQIQVEWERISTEKTPNYNVFTSRLKAPEGWVIRELLVTMGYMSDKGTACLSLTYVEDINHVWSIQA